MKLVDKMKLAIRQTIVFFVLLSVFSVLMISVHLISHESIKGQCEESAKTLQEEGLAPQILGIPLLKIDTFTDALMLNMAFCADEKQPVKSAFTNSFYTDDEMNVYDRTLELILSENKNAGGYEKEYARYWHGHQTVLRPLLTVLSYRQIIVLNCIVFFLTALLCLALVWLRLSSKLAMLMLASLLIVGLPVVPLCLQFSTCFYLMFLSMTAILAWPSLTNNSVAAACTFFVIGGLTSFFDLLTTPLLTLGFPLTICLLINRKWQSVRQIIRLSAWWFSGYALLWLSKCLVSLLLTGNNVISDFMTNATTRSLAGVYSLKELLANQFGTQIAIGICLGIVVAILLFIGLAVACWKHIKKQPASKRHSWLLLIALMVPLWLVATLQHAVVHYWFVWRALAVSFFAIFTYLYYTKTFDHEKDSRNHSLLQ